MAHRTARYELLFSGSVLSHIAGLRYKPVRTDLAEKDHDINQLVIDDEAVATLVVKELSEVSPRSQAKLFRSTSGSNILQYQTEQDEDRNRFQLVSRYLFFNDRNAIIRDELSVDPTDIQHISAVAAAAATRQLRPE